MWGRNVIRNFGQLGALAAVVDTDTARAEELATPFGSDVATLSDVLGDASIEALAVVTPSDTHHRIGRAALIAGKHVFIEKPLARTAFEAASLVETAALHNRTLMVGHLMLFHPAYERARQMVEAGALGELRYVYANRAAFGRFRGADDALWDLMCHDLAVFLDIAQSDVDTLRVVGACPLFPQQAEFAHAHLRFDSGLEGHIFASRLHAFKEQRLVLVGDKGTLVLNDRAATPAEKLMFYDSPVPHDDHQMVGQVPPGKPVAYDAGEPLRNECQHFLDCVRSGHTPRSDGSQGRRVVELLAHGTESIRTFARSPALPTKPALGPRPAVSAHPV